MGINWTEHERHGQFEISEQVDGHARSYDPGAPLGDTRHLLPGTYEVTRELVGAKIVSGIETGEKASAAAHYYGLDVGETVFVEVHRGTFSPATSASPEADAAGSGA